MTLTEAALAIWGHLLLRLAHYGLTIRPADVTYGLLGVDNNIPRVTEVLNRLRAD